MAHPVVERALADWVDAEERVAELGEARERAEKAVAALANASPIERGGVEAGLVAARQAFGGACMTAHALERQLLRMVQKYRGSVAA